MATNQVLVVLPWCANLTCENQSACKRVE